MPTYEYKCSEKPEDKDHTFKEIRSITSSEPENPICKIDGCGAKLIRVFNPPPIQFGKGFGGGEFK